MGDSRDDHRPDRHPRLRPDVCARRLRDVVRALDRGPAEHRRPGPDARRSGRIRGDVPAREHVPAGVRRGCTRRAARAGAGPLGVDAANLAASTPDGRHPTRARIRQKRHRRRVLGHPRPRDAASRSRCSWAGRSRTPCRCTWQCPRTAVGDAGIRRARAGRRHPPTSSSRSAASPRTTGIGSRPSTPSPTPRTHSSATPTAAGGGRTRSSRRACSPVRPPPAGSLDALVAGDRKFPQARLRRVRRRGFVLLQRSDGAVFRRPPSTVPRTRERRATTRRRSTPSSQPLAPRPSGL